MDIINSIIQPHKELIIKILSLGLDEAKNFFDDGLHDYLEKQRKKFISTKTFLFRIEDVNFYKVFFPAKIKNNLSSYNYDCLININNGIIERAVISGDAGSGKTMLIKALFLESIKRRHKIPILIELRHLNEFEGDFVKYIYTILLEKKIQPNNKILERILKKGGFLFLFDGYDEIYSNKIKKLNIEINNFVEKFDRNQFIITTRPGTNIEYTNGFRVFYVQPLEKQEITHFIEKQSNIIDDSTLGKKIIDSITKTENKDFQEYLTNPLLLSMFIFAFRVNPQIPKTKSKFYSNVFETLLTQHDSISKKGGFQHERRSRLKNEDIEKILKWFSFMTFNKGSYSFQLDDLKTELSLIKDKTKIEFGIDDLIYDLSTSISILIIDGIEFRFPHRSMQEFFSALLIRDFDDNTKQKVYDLYTKRNKSKNYESLHNFWQLSMELNELAFFKFFLLKQIEDLYIDPNESNEKKLITFFDIFNIELTISFGKDNLDSEVTFSSVKTVITFPHTKSTFYMDFVFFLWKIFFGYKEQGHPLFFITELSEATIMKIIDFKKNQKIYLGGRYVAIKIDNTFLLNNKLKIMDSDLEVNILYFYIQLESIYTKIRAKIYDEEDNLNFLSLNQFNPANNDDNGGDF